MSIFDSAPSVQILILLHLRKENFISVDFSQAPKLSIDYFEGKICNEGMSKFQKKFEKVVFLDATEKYWISLAHINQITL